MLQSMCSSWSKFSFGTGSQIRGIVNYKSDWLLANYKYVAERWPLARKSTRGEEKVDEIVVVWQKYNIIVPRFLAHLIRAPNSNEVQVLV